MKYEAPKLLRFGSFRDLTRFGMSGANDHLGVQSVGCNFTGCPTTPPPEDNLFITNDIVGSR